MHTVVFALITLALSPVWFIGYLYGVAEALFQDGRRMVHIQIGNIVR